MNFIHNFSRFKNDKFIYNLFFKFLSLKYKLFMFKTSYSCFQGTLITSCANFYHVYIL